MSSSGIRWSEHAAWRREAATRSPGFRLRGREIALANRLKFPPKPPLKGQTSRASHFRAVLEAAPFQTSDFQTSTRIPVTIVEQGTSGAAPQPAPDLIKETTTQTFVKDVIEGIEAPAGADRLLGAVVRPLPATLTPVLEKAVRAAKGKVKLVR